MSFDDNDLRDIFRRAFEEQQQRRGGTPPPSDDGPTPPGGQVPIPSLNLPDGWWRNRRFITIALGLTLFLSFNWIITTYTDWLWFQSVESVGVWARSFSARIITMLIFFTIALAFFLINIRIAFNGAAKTSTGFSPSQYKGFRTLITLLATFVAFGLGNGIRFGWETFLRFIYQVPTGARDPIYGRDLSFYFFDLPAYHLIHSWFFPLIFLTAIGTLGIYFLHNIEAVRRQEFRPQNIAPLRKHIFILGALLFFLIAIGHFLSRFDLLIETTGADLVAGAGYTDITIRSRMLLLNATLALLAAIALAYNAFRGTANTLRPLVLTGFLWIFSVVVLTGILPSFVERIAVAPNQLRRETPYLKHNIDYTRQAFGIDDIEVREFGDVTDLTTDDLEQNNAALANIRLWDYRVLPDNYEELQTVRTYYQFSDIDIDRYTIDGEMKQVMLGARELEKEALDNQSWENLRLEFTHGYGVAMNPVDEFSLVSGQPSFLIENIPPVTEFDELRIDRPEIYYGEKVNVRDIVYVGTNRQEFDYPLGDQNIRTSYAGEGGVPISGFLNRLAFAFRFLDFNILLNSDIGSSPNSRVMFHRNIADRINEVTPFLTLDFDPYMTIVDGRLVWMVDAYTTSRNHPYSEPFIAADPDELPFNRINYIRNAVKITVDAYDGTLNYYIADDTDPFIKTYARAFPDLFKPLSEMPAPQQAHIRYPESLFRIQTQQYLKYHMTDVGVFYNQEDLWEIPSETFEENSSRKMEPYYVIFRLPGETDNEYLLIQPYTPFAKQNMVAWLAARNDPEYYGELIAYTLPKQEVVLGPIQIEAAIEQNAEISSQLSLWNEGSSSAIRGNLLVIPLNNSFLYVEPLYLQSAGEGSRPELKRVIVASGDRVVMRESLDTALADLLGQSTSGFLSGNGEDVDGGSSTLELPEGAPATIEALAEQANAQMLRADEALQNNDWATYGEAQDALRNTLNQMLDILGTDG